MLSVVHTPVSPAVSHGMAHTTKTVLQRARINNLKAFSSVKLEIQQNTNGYFRKLEWPLLYTHYKELLSSMMSQW